MWRDIRANHGRSPATRHTSMSFRPKDDSPRLQADSELSVKTTIRSPRTLQTDSEFNAYRQVCLRRFVEVAESVPAGPDSPLPGCPIDGSRLLCPRKRPAVCPSGTFGGFVLHPVMVPQCVSNGRDMIPRSPCRDRRGRQAACSLACPDSEFRCLSRAHPYTVIPVHEDEWINPVPANRPLSRKPARETEASGPATSGLPPGKMRRRIRPHRGSGSRHVSHSGHLRDDIKNSGRRLLRTRMNTENTSRTDAGIRTPPRFGNRFRRRWFA